MENFFAMESTDVDDDIQVEDGYVVQVEDENGDVKVECCLPDILKCNFNVVSTLGKGNVIGKCKFCTASIKGNMKSTGNFRSHLKVICSFQLVLLSRLLYRVAELFTSKL